ncbi:MAG: 23S rRNA (guanosine(2251)-2'-O)-methyltransferase RlmB [Rikenellaceae bacterium]
MENTIFGIRPVLEALESGKELEKVYMKKGADGQLITELRQICVRAGVKVQDVPIEKLNKITRLNHQGVIAVVSTVEYASFDEMLEQLPTSRPALVVVFDGITDVRNFGAIARSAECAGADFLITPLKNSAPVNSEAIKSSAGALTRIPVCRVGSIRNTLKTLQYAGCQLVAASEKSDTLLYDADLTKPTVVIMGSEDKGISKEVLKMCDTQIAIPLKGSIESLNVSAAAAVILFETVRQRG